jgi:hypothetical protein
MVARCDGGTLKVYSGTTTRPALATRPGEQSFDYDHVDPTTGLFDQLGQAVEIGVGQLGAREVEKRRHGLLGGPVEKGVENPGQRRTPGALARQPRLVHVAVAVGGVADVALVFQDAQHGPDCRVAGGVGESLEDLADGGLALAVEHVHDLALAAGEGREGLLRRHRSGPPRC